MVTRQAADHAILRGITRTVLLDAIEAQGLALEERAFTLAEAYAAREAFVTSASQIVLPVVRSTAGRSATARPARSPPRCGGNFTATPRRDEFRCAKVCNARASHQALPRVFHGLRRAFPGSNVFKTGACIARRRGL